MGRSFLHLAHLIPLFKLSISNGPLSAALELLQTVHLNLHRLRPIIPWSTPFPWSCKSSIRKGTGTHFANHQSPRSRSLAAFFLFQKTKRAPPKPAAIGLKRKGTNCSRSMSDNTNSAKKQKGIASFLGGGSASSASSASSSSKQRSRRTSKLSLEGGLPRLSHLPRLRRDQRQ